MKFIKILLPVIILLFILTTIYAWTDNQITSNTSIKKSQVNELRAAIDDARRDVGLANYSWTDPVLNTSSYVRVAHFNETRTAIEQIYSRVGVGIPIWNGILNSSSIIRIIDIVGPRDNLTFINNTITSYSCCGKYGGVNTGSAGACPGTDDSVCGTIGCSGWYTSSGRTCYPKQDFTSSRCEGINNCKDANTADCATQPNAGAQISCGTCTDLSGCSGTTPGSCPNIGSGLDTYGDCSGAYTCVGQAIYKNTCNGAGACAAVYTGTTCAGTCDSACSPGSGSCYDTSNGADPLGLCNGYDGVNNYRCSGSNVEAYTADYSCSGAGCAEFSGSWSFDHSCGGGTPYCDSGSCVECTSDAHCNDGNACTSDTCSGGSCSHGNIADGTTAGSCTGGASCSGQQPTTLKCNGAGSCTAHNNGAACSGDCNSACSGGTCVDTSGGSSAPASIVGTHGCTGSTSYSCNGQQIEDMSKCSLGADCMWAVGIACSGICNYCQSGEGSCHNVPNLNSVPGCTDGNGCSGQNVLMNACDGSGNCNGNIVWGTCGGGENDRCGLQIPGNPASSTCINYCSDGIDNDGDGYTDGQDSNCGGCQQCSSGSCCNTATGCYISAGTSCRASAGACDVAETCSGSSSSCPSDSYLSGKQSCGQCYTCDGSGSSCVAMDGVSDGAWCGGNWCNGAAEVRTNYCSSGSCTSYQSSDCNDGNDCTNDGCSSASCTHSNVAIYGQAGSCSGCSGCGGDGFCYDTTGIHPFCEHFVGCC